MIYIYIYVYIFLLKIRNITYFKQISRCYDIFSTFSKNALKDIARINFVRTIKLKPVKGRSSRLLF